MNIQEVKDYMYFDVGTWWLYEEENTLQKDCVYVVEAYQQEGNYIFDVKTKNTLSDWTTHYWPRYFDLNNDCVPGGMIYQKCLNIYRSKYKSGDFMGESYCFFFLLSEGEFIGSYGGEPYGLNNKLTVSQEIDTFSNFGLTYGLTYKMHEENTVTENQQPTNHFYSRGIGLTRKELIDSNQVWNLIDYNIVK